MKFVIFVMASDTLEEQPRRIAINAKAVDSVHEMGNTDTAMISLSGGNYDYSVMGTFEEVLERLTSEDETSAT